MKPGWTGNGFRARHEAGFEPRLRGVMRGVGALRRIEIAGGALALCLALSACADQPSPILSAAGGSAPAASASGQSESAPRLAPRPGVSPAGASVAFISFDGPPPAVTSRFHAAMGRALGAADVTTAPSTSAHYLVQGHLSAWPAEKGVALSWVWDVFDARRARVHCRHPAMAARGQRDGRRRSARTRKQARGRFERACRPGGHGGTRQAPPRRAGGTGGAGAGSG
jgi:hypothetical protein